MDFDRDTMLKTGVGRYEPIDIPNELRLYVAFRTDLAEGSEILHSRLRDDYENGVPSVLAAIKEWASLTEQMKKALESRRFDEIPPLLDRNFDLRCEVCGGSISAKNRQMVEIARSNGASAKFTGSGGAIIGTYAFRRRISQSDMTAPFRTALVSRAHPPSLPPPCGRCSSSTA